MTNLQRRPVAVTADWGLGFDLDQTSVGRLGLGDSFFSRARLFDYRLMKQTERFHQHFVFVCVINMITGRRPDYAIWYCGPWRCHGAAPQREKVIFGDAGHTKWVDVRDLVRKAERTIESMASPF
jgi:hypothetical protein